MGKVPVDDNMNEVIRKAAQDSSDGTKYDLRSHIANETVSVVQDEQFKEQMLSLLNDTCEKIAKTNELLMMILSRGWYVFF